MGVLLLGWRGRVGNAHGWYRGGGAVLMGGSSVVGPLGRGRAGRPLMVSMLLMRGRGGVGGLVMGGRAGRGVLLMGSPPTQSRHCMGSRTVAARG